MGASPFGFIDGYCERTAPGLLNEPLNAVTNLAFVVAAILLWRLARRENTAADRLVSLPILFVLLTGLGSFAFHTMANRLGAALDVLALSTCLLLTVYDGARRWLGWSPGLALLWPGGMIVASALTGWLVPLPGAVYLGAFVTGMAMAVMLGRGAHPAAPWVAGAAVVFIPSYAMRSLDLPFCQMLPMGTHFGWHLLNAVVLYLAIRPLAVRT